MSEIETITALEQTPVKVKLSFGEFEIKPLSIRRLSKLVAMFKDLQGNPEKFKDVDSPDFHRGVADALVAAGENMPKAVALLTGAPELEKQDDLSLLDLGAIILAAAKANKASGLKSFFMQAKDEILGTPVQK